MHESEESAGSREHVILSCVVDDMFIQVPALLVSGCNRSMQNTLEAVEPNSHRCCDIPALSVWALYPPCDSRSLPGGPAAGDRVA